MAKPDFITVECIACGVVDGHPCKHLYTRHDVNYFHKKRKLLWVLRQEREWAQLPRPDEDKFVVEMKRLQERLNEVLWEMRSIENAKESVSIDSPEGQAELARVFGDPTVTDLRIKISNLTRLLSRAVELIDNARPGVREGMAGEENVKEWFAYADQFKQDYTMMKEKRS